MADESLEKAVLPKKRRWCLKRWFVIVFVLLLVLVSAWTIWLLVARVQFRAAVDAIRRRGQPVTFSELFPETLPDDENAVVSLQEAIGAYENDIEPLINSLEEQLAKDNRVTDGLVVFETLYEYPKLRRIYFKQLRAILKAGDAMLAKLAEMQQSNIFAWDIQNRNEMLLGNVLYRCRRMEKYLRVCSQIAHDEGDDAQALEYIKQMRSLQNAPASGKTPLAILVCISFDALSIEAIEDIAPSLRIGDESGMVSRKQVQSLMQSMLNDELYQETFRQGFLGERVFGLSIVQDILDQKLNPMTAMFFHKAYTTPVWSTLCLPILYSDTARHLEAMKQKVYEPYQPV